MSDSPVPASGSSAIGGELDVRRGGPGDWRPDRRPSHLREAGEGSLRRLKVEAIDLHQLHRIDEKVATEDQIGTLIELRDEGKIRHIGLSEVTTDQLEEHCGAAAIRLSDDAYDQLTDAA